MARLVEMYKVGKIDATTAMQLMADLGAPLQSSPASSVPSGDQDGASTKRNISEVDSTGGADPLLTKKPKQDMAARLGAKLFWKLTFFRTRLCRTI